jgi:hypothetical protein
MVQAAAALAFFVERRRARLHLTVEVAARLTGIELSQGVCARGRLVPEDRLDIQAIAATIEGRRSISSPSSTCTVSSRPASSPTHK